MHRADIIPSKVRAKRREVRRMRALFGLLGSVAVLALLAFLSHWSAINVRTITVSGNVVTPSFEIEKAAQDIMASAYLYVFPKTNILLAPKTRIEKDVLSTWPRIKEVEVRTDSFDALKIQVTERNPEYLWCGDQALFATVVRKAKGQVGINNATSTPIASTSTSAASSSPSSSVGSIPGQKCFYLDANGYLFAEAPYISGDAYFRLYGGDLAESVAANEASASSTPFRHLYTSTEKFTNMNSFLNALRGVKLTPTHLLLKKSGDVEVLLADGCRIFVQLDQDLDKALRAVQVAIGNDLSLTRTFDYIDVRYENKIYSKKR